MGPRRVARSKEAWFDELHLSWVQLGEIIATWWEIRAGPCCAARERLQLWKRSRFSSPANSAAHTSVTERAETKQHTHTDNTININVPLSARPAAQLQFSEAGESHNHCCKLHTLRISVLSGYSRFNKRTFCFLLEATGQCQDSNPARWRLELFLLPSSRRPC